MSWFVDTNVFVRLLTRDDAAKTSAVLRLFQQARDGDAQLITSEAIIAEVVYVLSSKKQYGYSREHIADVLPALVNIPSLRITNRAVILDAIELYRESTLDFEDCLAAAYVQRQDLEGVYSYDRGFDAVDGLTRREP